jgi:hypothetical protein
MAISFQVAINQKYKDKVKPGDGRFWDFNMSFQNTWLTLPKLLGGIREGYAWTAPHRHVRHHRPTTRNPRYRTSYRVKANVMGSQLLALDSDTGDERSRFDTLLTDPFIAKYAGLLHATASATRVRPRTRIIFVLDKPVKSVVFEESLKALLFRYPFCDQSVNHAAAVFYGAQHCDYHLTEKVLPLAVLEEAIRQPYQNYLTARQRKRETERQRRQNQYGQRDAPDSDQVTRYVLAVRQNLLDELGNTPPGQGQRHQRLYIAAITLGRLSNASWITVEAQQRLANASDELFRAAETNGYVAAYGEDDALRTIENGLDNGRLQPLDEPVWYEERPFFQLGDWVQAVVKGRVIAVGRVKRYRENEHWEYELDAKPNMWFARSLLQPAVSE